MPASGNDAKTGIYISHDIRELYSPVLNHLAPRLRGYDAVGVIGYSDTHEIRDMMLAKDPADRDARLTRIVERMFPGQSATLLSTLESRAAVVQGLSTMLDGNRGGPLAFSAQISSGGQPVRIGMIFLNDTLASHATTPQSEVLGMPGVAREDHDPVLREQLQHDNLILTSTHEIGHLVHFIETGTFVYDTTRQPPFMTFSTQEALPFENYADSFAAAQIPELARASIVTHADIATQFRHSRQLNGIIGILDMPPGAPPALDHATALLDGGNRLSTAGMRMNRLWQEYRAQSNQLATPANTYAFTLQLRERTDVAQDVRELARNYVEAYEATLQGRILPPSKIGLGSDVQVAHTHITSRTPSPAPSIVTAAEPSPQPEVTKNPVPVPII